MTQKERTRSNDPNCQRCYMKHSCTRSGDNYTYCLVRIMIFEALNYGRNVR